MKTKLKFKIITIFKNVIYDTFASILAWAIILITPLIIIYVISDIFFK